MPTVYVGSNESVGHAYRRLEEKVGRERIRFEYKLHACHMTKEQIRKAKKYRYFKKKRRT